MPKCDRCKLECFTIIMSRFNTQMICDDCEDKEMAHPDYQKAVNAEIKALSGGNRNFEGIGLPNNLQGR